MVLFVASKEIISAKTRVFLKSLDQITMPL
jgi:hypothetical protein